MDNANLKKLILVFLIIILFVFSFTLVFGNNNLVVPIIVILTGVMTLRSDFSVSPKISLIKLTIIFWACAIVGYLNSPNNYGGLILGFLLIFMITFSSFKELSNDSHLAFVMCYLLLMVVPVTGDGLMLRILALTVGALLIVALNSYFHKSKSYNSKEELINSVLDDLIGVVDSKINNETYNSNITTLNNNLSMALFDNLGRKYIDEYKRESLATICKSAEYIEELLNKYELSVEELDYIKEYIIAIKSNKKLPIGSNFTKISLILLNLEVMSHEIRNKNNGMEITFDFDSIKSFIISNFSFSSIKFTFSLKLAFLISLWELVGLLFDLPYVKWLYFSSLLVLVPYTDNVSDNSKIRIKSTIYGEILFIIIMLLFFSEYSVFNIVGIVISSQVIFLIMFLLMIFILLIFITDQIKRSMISTVLSMTVALQYIDISMAVYLKISWLILSIVVATILTKYILPYSIEKETFKFVRLYQKLNDSLIKLIKKQLQNDKIYSKSHIIVSCDVISNHIKLNNDSLQDLNIDALLSCQRRITTLCDFVLNYLQLKKISSKDKSELLDLISKEEKYNDLQKTENNIVVEAINYIKILQQHENNLIEKIE